MINSLYSVCLLECIFGYFNVTHSIFFIVLNTLKYNITLKSEIKPDYNSMFIFLFYIKLFSRNILDSTSNFSSNTIFYNYLVNYRSSAKPLTISPRPVYKSLEDNVLLVSSTFRNFYNNKDIIFYKNSRVIDSFSELGNTRDNLLVYGENLGNSFSKRWFRIIYSSLTKYSRIVDYTTHRNAWKYRDQVLRVVHNSTTHFYSLDVTYFFSSIFFNYTQTWSASTSLPTFSMIYLKVIRHRRSHSTFIRIIKRFLKALSNMSNSNLLSNRNKSVSSFSCIYDYDGFIKGRAGNLKRVITKRFLYRKTYLSVKSHSGDGYFPSMYGSTRNTRWGSTSFYIVFYIKI